MLLDIGDGVSEKGRQSLRGLGNIRTVRQQGVCADGLQGVIEEVGVDLVLQRQIFRLFLPQSGDLLSVKPLFHICEKCAQIQIPVPVHLQNGLQVPLPPVAPQRPPQFPVRPRPHGITYL